MQVNSMLFMRNEYYARSENCEKRLLAASCLSVCPSVPIEHLRNHCTDSHGNLIFEYISKIFREYSSFTKNLQE